MKREYDFSAGLRGKFFRPAAKLREPDSDEEPEWVSPGGALGQFTVREAQATLESYRAQPHRVTEDANAEQFAVHGGYAHRQLYELVQNSADALLGSLHGRSILVRLTDRFLYCADNGVPVDEAGVVGLMFSRMSSKLHTTAIGRFGVGFKSVLGVTDAPEFYSRSVSLRFDKNSAAERIAIAIGDAGAASYPVLRLPEPIDPGREMDGDEELEELMSWATNVVRLPLKAGAHEDLAQQIRDFPPEFLLFVDHVRYLTLEDDEHSREFMLKRRDGELILDDQEVVTRWRRYEKIHRVSDVARNDWPLSGATADVSIQWAAPVDRLDRPGQFWAFFPTETASLVAGILNAAWKTNEDRLNLLPGPYNEELIDAAAVMIAESLPKLATEDDPGRHLDALPRRRGRDDSRQADILRTRLFAQLRDMEVVPDQKGRLRTIGSISYPPRRVTDVSETEALERWAAYDGRPTAWLHHGVIAHNRVTRLAILNRLSPPRWDGDEGQSVPQASVARWLEALVEGKANAEAIAASKAAVRTAAAVPKATAGWGEDLGRIVLTADGDWRPPDGERVFLPGGAPDEIAASGTSFVHPGLVASRGVLSALRKLGIKSPSPESAFRAAAKRVMARAVVRELSGEVHRDFWEASRDLPAEAAKAVIQEATDWAGREAWPGRLRIRTRAGTWRSPHQVLLPGGVVSEDDIDEDAIVDIGFHGPDEDLLRALGVVDAPEDGRDLSLEPLFWSFLDSCRRQYSRRSGLPRVPRSVYLDFMSSSGAGPLGVLEALSDEGKARYTEALLDLEGGLKRWTIWHTGTNRQEYPKVPCVSFTTHMLRKHGRLRTPHGIVPLASASGPRPASGDALRLLLGHSNVSLLKDAFGLIEPTPEIHGADDPIPLTDVWRGLDQHLPLQHTTCELVRCERIIVGGEPRDCVLHASAVYLADTADDGEPEKVRLVVDELGLGLSDAEIVAVLRQRTVEEVEERRDAVRKCPTDSLRLLAAVGEQAIRVSLPASLLPVLESNGTTLSGAEVAETAIATWHTDSLRRLKWALDDLDPPSQWAGSPQTVEFVTSLGFAPEWAGERESRRDPFVEVEGPRSLPKLHGFQRIVVDNIRKMLRGGNGNGADRRGIVSMPTGSGKTRVAVQAVVEAIRDDGLRSGVLWIADRDELCEQAVECWRHVWASVGSEAVQLRISRLWAGLEKPKPTSRNHVIVATIQTLNARLSNEPDEYAFVGDFGLVVFDEAHRSIARTFTSVMQEMGLTRVRRTDEPFLLGLTATPYRGRDEAETRRLVNRYGNRRLDAGAFESDEPEAVIRELQHTGVLAEADHETIEGGTFSLDTLVDESLGNGGLERKLDELRTLPWLPQSVEERIARSVARTKRIVEAYTGHIEEKWPALVFATSVEHTQTVAALLNREGVRSRAISGETDRSTRRRVVEEFRRGEVKALVNYGVFREGFDAPKTRAIVVARPVYSPNLYFQMVGRGLRGPLNGGDERCLILDVEDNIENFNRQLAFSELHGLWARDA